jgi:hypothetical protein
MGLLIFGFYLGICLYPNIYLGISLWFWAIGGAKGEPAGGATKKPRENHKIKET